MMLGRRRAPSTAPKYENISGAIQHIPTGAARGGGLFRGADRALEGADEAGQTGLVALSPQQIFAPKLSNELSNGAIVFPYRFWTVCERSGHFMAAIQLV